MGGLGEALAIRLRPFGVRMAGDRAARASRERSRTAGHGMDRRARPASRLLSRSDYLFLCLHLTEETRGLIDAARLARLPQDACVINVGRGGLIDHAALLGALNSGRLLGAALDVFEQEPLDPASPLLKRPDILATPHIAGVTDASYRGIAERMAANMRRLINGERLEDCVNWDAIRAGR